MKAKSIEADELTHDRYRLVIQHFFVSLGVRADRDLSMLQPTEIAKFRDAEASKRSRSTADLSLKVLACLEESVRQNLLAVNPASRVSILKSREKAMRRAFTVSEIKRILRACREDAE